MIFRTHQLRPEPAPGFGKVIHRTRTLWITGSSRRHRHFIRMRRHFRHLSACLMGSRRPSLCPTPTGTAAAATSLFQSTIGEPAMISNASEAAIDQIVANCNGDIRGALKALLLVNERLEAELAEFYAAVGLDGMARGSNAV